MRSATEQLEMEHGLDNALSEGGEPGALKALIDEGIAKQALSVPDSRDFNRQSMQARANAKLKLVYATRTPQAKPTGVKFVSAGHDQVQEIFDDGSVRNPYKVNREMSGRQRRHMRKVANRTMRARGLVGKIQNVLKGRRVETPGRPQSETPQSPVPTTEPLTQVGTPVAAVVGD